MINKRLKKLEKDIKKVSKDEIETEKLNEIVNSVERVLDFNYQNQEGQRLKILTLDQMLSRLTIVLAKLKVESNSEELKKK